MSNTETHNAVLAAVPSGVDGAVGVPEAKWFVAIVNSRHEKKVAESLQKMGIESYVATQKEMRIWRNGKRKMIDRVVIPSVVFIKCTEPRRHEIVSLPFIFRFMVNRMADSGTPKKPVATIPERQMSTLKFMLGQSDYSVEFVPTAFRINDNVRVIRGKLKGLEGMITGNADGSHSLTVGLDLLGGAIVKINPQDVEKI